MAPPVNYPPPLRLKFLVAGPKALVTHFGTGQVNGGGGSRAICGRPVGPSHRYIERPLDGWCIACEDMVLAWAADVTRRRAAREAAHR